jgi:hypothetical protein
VRRRRTAEAKTGSAQNTNGFNAHFAIVNSETVREKFNRSLLVYHRLPQFKAYPQRFFIAPARPYFADASVQRLRCCVSKLA